MCQQQHGEGAEFDGVSSCQCKAGYEEGAGGQCVKAGAAGAPSPPLNASKPPPSTVGRVLTADAGAAQQVAPGARAQTRNQWWSCITRCASSSTARTRSSTGRTRASARTATRRVPGGSASPRAVAPPQGGEVPPAATRVPYSRVTTRHQPPSLSLLPVRSTRPPPRASHPCDAPPALQVGGSGGGTRAAGCYLATSARSMTLARADVRGAVRPQRRVRRRLLVRVQGAVSLARVGVHARSLGFTACAAAGRLPRGRRQVRQDGSEPWRPCW